MVAALAARGRAGATGTLQVTGDPGGWLRLDGGRATGAESPGSPGAEALLLRSGRVLESAWVAAYQAGAPHGRLAVELVRRGLVGAAELEAVCLMALFDAAFAIAAGTVEGCRWEAAAGSDGDLAAASQRH
ncbi:MarR family transcriptional regulator, partial [Streptacidiphilus pinicola]